MSRPAAMVRCSRKTCPPWYDQAFGLDYLKRYRHRSDAEAAAHLRFLRSSLKLKPTARVLDLCCGSGRHARALRGLKVRVVAIDRSRPLLKAARRRAPNGGIAYLRADMRCLPLKSQSMDGAVNLFTSFGYFSSETENRQVLREVARVLKRGGMFVLDFFNLHRTLAELVPCSERALGDMRLIETRKYDRGTKRLSKNSRLLDRAGREVGRAYESVRAYSATELRRLLGNCGLQVVARYGDLLGATFNVRQSARCVLVARKHRCPVRTGH